MFRDTYDCCIQCETCQKLEALTLWNDKPLTLILTLEIFDCWAIDFIGPFPSLNGYLYIRIAIGYVYKRIEVTTCGNNDHQTIIKLLKKIYCHDLKFPKPS